jgi:hypothetical protein
MRDFWETFPSAGALGAAILLANLCCVFWIERIKTKHRRGFAVQLRTLGVEVRLCARSPMGFLSLMLGVRRAGVTVALNYLEHRGIIRLSRKQIVITDRYRVRIPPSPPLIIQAIDLVMLCRERCIKSPSLSTT